MINHSWEGPRPPDPPAFRATDHLVALTGECEVEEVRSCAGVVPCGLGHRGGGQPGSGYRDVNAHKS